MNENSGHLHNFKFPESKTHNLQWLKTENSSNMWGFFCYFCFVNCLNGKLIVKIIAVDSFSVNGLIIVSALTCHPNIISCVIFTFSWFIASSIVRPLNFPLTHVCNDAAFSWCQRHTFPSLWPPMTSYIDFFRTAVVYNILMMSWWHSPYNDLACIAV